MSELNVNNINNGQNNYVNNDQNNPDDEKVSILAEINGLNTAHEDLDVMDDNGPDEKHIYLPALKSVRRVNSSEGSKAFMGSDATYDDLKT